MSTSPSHVTAILTGSTAAGKTSAAIKLAELYQKIHASSQIELVNADSISVYRHFNIGSAKPSLLEQKNISHHLLDIKDPEENTHAGEFHRACEACLQDIHSRGNRALIVGGTGFYLKGLLLGSWGDIPANPQLRMQLEDLDNQQLFQQLLAKDEAWALKVSAGDRYRLIRALEVIEQTGKTPSQLEAQTSQEPDPQFRLLVLDRPNKELHSRIETRTQKMLEAGWIEEVEDLIKRFPQSRALNSVGYQQVKDYLQQKKPAGRKMASGLQGLQDEVNLATRQLVKKQRTWFKAQKGAEHFLLEKDRNSLEKALKEIYAL